MRRILLFPPVRWIIFGLLYALIGLPFLFLPYISWVTRVVGTLAPLLALAILVWGIEGRDLRTGGLGLQGGLRDLLGGLAGGGLLIGLSVGVIAMAGWYRVESVGWERQMLLSSLPLWLEVAVREEVIFRAVIFRSLEEYLGSWLSLLGSALLFGLAHWFNPGSTWVSTLGIAVEAGILLGAAYMLTRSVWLAVGIHWGWNLFQGTVFGLPVSGIDTPSLMQATLAGPEWATGGAFGLEAGLPTIVMATAAGVGLLVLAARQKQVLLPIWQRRR